LCHPEIRCRKPVPQGYPEHPRTIGEHIKKRRMDRGLLQHEVAEEMGVCAWTVINWELRRCMGLTQRELARSLRVDEGTLRFWEQARYRPTTELRARFEEFRSALASEL